LHFCICYIDWNWCLFLLVLTLFCSINCVILKNFALSLNFSSLQRLSIIFSKHDEVYSYVVIVCVSGCHRLFNIFLLSIITDDSLRVKYLNFICNWVSFVLGDDAHLNLLFILVICCKKR
jgi:hypothetical protein